MIRYSPVYLLFYSVLLLGACGRWQVTSVQSHDYTHDTLAADPAMLEMIAPYIASIDSTMDQVVTELPFDLEKGKPNGNLGFWMADACRNHALRKSGQTICLDPMESANKIAKVLKEEKKCDLVVCLSHLGYKYSGNKISDRVLARESFHIDLILGGHTHTFLDEPEELLNKNGHLVIVNQSGWGGILIGRLDIVWSRGGKPANPHNTMLKVS